MKNKYLISIYDDKLFSLNAECVRVCSALFVRIYIYHTNGYILK